MLTSFSAITDSPTRLTLQQLSRRLDDAHLRARKWQPGKDAVCVCIVWLQFSPLPCEGRGWGESCFSWTACRKPLTSILSPHERVEADSCEADIMTHRSSLTAD